MKTEVEGLVQSIDVPPVPLAEIHDRMTHLSFPQIRRRENRLAVAAAVAAAAVMSMVPLFSPAVMQSIEARYRAAVQALGGIAPPPAPKLIVSKLRSASQNVTLAQAQSRVQFKIDPPSGLPKDVVSSKIILSPVGVYSKQTRSWSVGPNEVRFFFRRANGREFSLFADRYDPHGAHPGKYIFETAGLDRNGHPLLIKHRRFAWRNGDQQIVATEGSDLTSNEILSIQSAMHGTSLPLRNLHTPDTSSTNTLRVLIKP